MAVGGRKNKDRQEPARRRRARREALIARQMKEVERLYKEKEERKC